MSHLLSRLADRALGVSPGIEPVRLPMFGAEPSPHRENFERESKDFVYGEIVGAAQATRSATPESIDRPADPPVGRKDGIETGAAADSPVRPADSEVFRAPLSTARDDSFSSRPVDRQQSLEPDESPVASSGRSDAGGVFTAEPEPVTGALSPVAIRASRSVDGDSAPGEPEASDTGQRAPSRPGGTSVAEAGLRPGEYTGPTFSIRDVISQLPTETSRPQPQAPTIKVNIGRIEVRAVTPPPVPAPRQKKQPQSSLSLDEYLRQRSGGRR